MEYLKVWTNFGELLEELTDAECGRLFKAMLAYAESGELLELSGNERYVWPAARQIINNTRDRSEQMKANGSKSKQIEANRSKTEQTEAKESKSPYKDKVKDKYKDKEIKENPLKGVKESAPRFTPPTVDEVAEYCRERKNNINAQTFVDFYAAKGWRVGNQPMRDWKASVRTWEQRDNNGAPPQKPRLLRAQDYHQREYDEKEMVKLLGADDFMLTDEEYMKRYGKARDF